MLSGIIVIPLRSTAPRSFSTSRRCSSSFRGRAKVELALAKGKQTHDKRQTIKERDWQRDKARLLRDRG